MLKRISKVLLPTVLGLFVFASVASAHVTVVPKTSTTGAWETYTMKVPVEKDVPTVKVTLKAPEGVEIMSYQPVPGWNYSAEKGSDGKVTSITYEATGEGILPGQFQSFTFVAKNPADAGKVAWDAFQFYKDGSVVEWTGDEGADKPHAITDIVASAATDDHHDEATTDTDKHDEAAADTTKTDDTSSEDSSSSSLPLILSIVAVLLSLVAVVAAFRKR